MTLPESYIGRILVHLLSLFFYSLLESGLHVKVLAERICPNHLYQLIVLSEMQCTITNSYYPFPLPQYVGVWWLESQVIFVSGYWIQHQTLLVRHMSCLFSCNILVSILISRLLIRCSLVILIGESIFWLLTNILEAKEENDLWFPFFSFGY